MPSRRALLVWLIIAALSVPLQFVLDRRLSTLGTVRGSESAMVDRRVREEFDSPYASPVVLVISGLRANAELDSTRADVRAIGAPLRALPWVSGMISPASSLDTLLLGATGTTAIAIVGIRREMPGAVDSLRAITSAMIPALRRVHPSITLRWTGEQAVVGDLRQESAREARTAEMRAFPVTALIAAWAFGSVTAALTALVAAALVIAVSLGAFGALSGVVEPSMFVRTVVPLVGLALTVDYSLYLRRSAAAGVAPVMKTLTFSDPLNLAGTQSWTAIGSNIDGSGFTELFTFPFTGTTSQFPLVPSGYLPADRQQGLLAQLLAADGSMRECKLMVTSLADLVFELGPNVAALSYAQNTSGATTMDYSYTRQPEYNLFTKITQKDLTGRFQVDFLTTGRYNLGTPAVNLKTSDLPSGWWHYNSPNNTEVDFKFKGYGLVGGTPGPSHALRGPQQGDKWIVATSFQYRF